MSSTESSIQIKQHDLSLGGHALTISTDHDQVKMDLIAEMANEKIESAISKNYSYQKSLMVALLQICEEKLNLQKNMNEKVHGIEQKAEQVLQKLNNCFDLE